jgi:hypothetical protein
MRSKSTLFVLMAAPFLSGVPARAVDVQVQGIDQLFACGPGGCGGLFQGMVGGTLDAAGNLIGGTVVQLMCIDYQNDTYIPSVAYGANISSVTNGSSMANTRHGGSPNPDPTVGTWSFTTNTINYGGSQQLNLGGESNALERYQMVTWLASQYNTPGVNNDAVQTAIWQLMATNAGAGPTATSASNVWLSQSAQWYQDSGGASSAAAQQLLSNYQVVTNFNPLVVGAYPGQIQEFLVDSVAPEPRYLLLLAPWMMAIWLWRRRSLARG